jgi:lysophospholipase L1-like esterase
MNNRILREVTLAVMEINHVAAKVSVGVKNFGGNIRAKCFEVGVDGSKPDSPVAVAGPDLTLRIGTPFLWSKDSQPRYAIVVSAENDRITECSEIQFGFDGAGKIVVTENLKAVSFTPRPVNPILPSLFVVGDSTAFCNGINQRGWGDELSALFDLNKINVCNRARPGRSTRSFRNEGLWACVLTELKPGDVVLVQFGHNDADKLAEGRCRGVLPGLGEETQPITLPDGNREIVHTFGWYLRKFVEETKAKGATPILLSLTAKNLWREGRLERQQGEYGKWSAAVAAACGIEFIDVTQIIADRYDALGWQEVQPLFCGPGDNVHASPAGARMNADCVVAGLKGLKSSIISSCLRHLC